MWCHDHFEQTLGHDGFPAIAGVDEVGGGALAGPVPAEANVLDPCGDSASFRDSKVLSAAQRRLPAERIQEEAPGMGFGRISELEIDRIEILQAAYKAMREAVRRLPCPPDTVIANGCALSGPDMPRIGIAESDSCSYSIAAASILAKVKRGENITSPAPERPQDGFEHHKGYVTGFHRRAIAAHGPSPYHRQTFHGVRAAGAKDVH
jgi:ribonuclease HII